MIADRFCAEKVSASTEANNTHFYAENFLKSAAKVFHITYSVKENTETLFKGFE